MKPLMMMGALLTALGILALVFRDISYTSRETVAEGDSVTIQEKRERTLEIPAAAGAVVLVSGVGLMILAARQ